MFKNYVFVVAILYVFFLWSCGSSQPARTNVLNTPPPGKSTRPVQGNPPKQTVFTTPDQQTKVETKPQPTYTPPPREVDNTPVNTTEAGTAAAGTKEYYRSRNPGLQLTAKPTYYRVLDSVNRVISRLPSNTTGKPDVNQPEWFATTNFNARKPNYVVLHHTAQNSADQTLYTFAIPRTQVSSHYVVSRDGVVYQMLNDYLRAWHAGNCRWGSITDMNSCSIGIEIDNNGSEPFSDAQIAALIKLLSRLKDNYDIPQANFIGHSDIAPKRKNDPSKYFPWKRLADAGFGYWYDSTRLKTPPADFNALLALRVIGYDVRDQAAAIQAFKLHYIQNDNSPRLSDYDKTVLYNVYLNY